MIKTNSYVLKKFKISYVNLNYLKWFKDSNTKKYIQFNCKNLKELKENVNLRINQKNSFFFGIFTKNNKHIGNIFISKINKINKTAILGILIGDKKFRGKGVGHEVIKSSINWLNKNFDIKKIYLGLSPKNTHALKLYLKVGFTITYQDKDYIKMEYNYLSNKFVLGTAQFGSAYGITNKNKKKISNKEIKKILYFCKRNKVNHLDTAETYNFNYKLLNQNTWKIDTKITINKRYTSYKILKKYLIKKKSNKNICFETIYIHNPENIFSAQGKIIMKILFSLQKQKFFKFIGVSVYDVDILKKIIKKYRINVVQVPYNIIDRRFEILFSELFSKKIKIYARSIFLQGLLITKSSKFKEIKDIKKFYNFSRYNKVSQIDACLDFVKHNVFIDKLLFGIQDENQLKKIIKSNYKKKINYPIYLKSKNYKLIDPRSWTNSFPHLK